jgi:hypothetical protein
MFKFRVAAPHDDVTVVVAIDSYSGCVRVRVLECGSQAEGINVNKSLQLPTRMLMLH